MNQPEPAKIQVYHHPNAIYADATFGVAASDFLLLHQSLLAAIHNDFAHTSPTQPESILVNLQRKGEQEWLAALNRVATTGSAPITLDTFHTDKRYFTHQFYWAAYRYAVALSYSQLVYNIAFCQTILTKVAGRWAKWRALAHIYRRLPASLQALTIVPIEIKKQGFRVIAGNWHEAEALKHIPIDYEAIYGQDVQQVLTTIFRLIPELTGCGESILVEQEHEENFSWTVAWQESIRRQRRMGLIIGLLLSTFLIIVALFVPSIVIYSLIFVPVIVGWLWYFALSLHHYAGEQEFAQQETVHRTNEQVNALERLHQIDRELNRALGLDRVLSLWQDWAIRMTHAKAGSIVIVDSRRGTLQLAQSFGYPTEQIQSVFGAGRRISWMKGITGRAARTANAFYEPDTRTNSDYVQVTTSTRSQFSVPIVHGEKVVAVLSLEKNDVNAFSKEERARITHLCQRAAPAVTNALLLQQAEEERQKLSAVLTNVTEGIIVTDPKGHIILLNRRAAHIFNLDAQQSFVSRNFIDVFRSTPLTAFFREGLSKEGLITQEIPYGQSNFQCAMLPVLHVGYLLVLQDITIFKELDNLKNDLIATVSHDLKNPITVVKGYLELIQMVEDLSDRSIVYLERARNSIRDMTDLIDGLLSVARLETGLKPTLLPISLPLMLKTVTEKYRFQLEEKAMQLQVNVDPSSPLVLGEPERVEQIIGNLLSNAIKYTPPNGHVLITTKPDAQNRVVISVQDSGIGIPDDALPSLFNKFTRVRDSKAVGIEGTGLGLYIVKRLVEAHGGEIAVRSIYGEGSTFSFSLIGVQEPPTDETIRLERLDI